MIKGNGDEARKLYQQAAKISSKDGCAIVAYANFEAKHNVSKAINVLESGLKRVPMDEKLAQALGSQYIKVGRYDEARTLLRKSIDIKPNGPAFVALISLEYQDMSKKGPAVKKSGMSSIRDLFEEGVRVDPLHGPLYNAYAYILLSEKQTERAKDIFEKAIEKHCSDSVSLYVGYGCLELREENLDAARRIFRKGIEELGHVSPAYDLAFLYHSLGMLEIHTFNLREARLIFEEGLKRCPENSRVIASSIKLCIQTVYSFFLDMR